MEEQNTENTETIEESGTTEEDLSVVPEFEDSDIEELLSTAVAEEHGLDTSEDSDEEDEDSESEGSTGESEEAEDSEEPEEQESAEDAQLEDDVTQEQLAALQKQIEGQELLVKRRISEFGEIKNRLNQLIQNLESSLEEKFAVSPKEALEDRDKIQQAKQKIEEINANEQAILREHQARKIFHANVQPGEVSTEDMVRTLQGDGIGPEYIAAFQKNPYSFMNPDGLVQLAKRAKVEKAFVETVSMLKAVIEENKKLKNKPKNILDKVEKTWKSPPQITGANGGAAPRSKGDVSLSPSQIANLSDKKLKELLANL